jgi:hypothetical protein
MSDANFRLLLLLIIEVNSILGLLHRVDVGDVSDVSEVHAASTLRVDERRFVRICVHIALISWKQSSIYTQKLTNLKTYTLKNEAPCTSETMSTSPTCTQQTTQEQN